jgi:hypothetical protein
MTEPTHTEEAPAYTRESVMAYLRAAEAERTRLRSAIDEARARASSARSRVQRLDALVVGPDVRSGGPGDGSSVSPLDALISTRDCPRFEPTATHDTLPESEWPALDGVSGHQGVPDPDALIEEFRSSLADDTSTWWPVDPMTGDRS